MEKSQNADEKLGDDSQQLKDMIFSSDGTGKVWQEGWYIYQDGKIQGPLGLMEALTRPYFGADHKPVLLSRRGYTQWYELSFLAPKITPKVTTTSEKHAYSSAPPDLMRTKSSSSILGKKHIPTADIFDTSLLEKSKVSGESRLFSSDDGSEFKTPNSRLNKIKQVSKFPSLAPSLVKPVFPESVEHANTNVKDESYYPMSVATADLAYKNYQPAVNPSIQDEERSNDSSQGLKAQGGRVSQKLMNPPTKGEIIQEYFISRGKLRLGTMRSAFIFGSIGFIGTLGLIWGYWVIKSYREIEFHCDGRSKLSWMHMPLALIPGVHLIYAFLLGVQVVKMERQNRYSSISPFVAMFLGLFPPVAIFYLQKAINGHWLLHAKSALLKEMR